ncbi:MAG: HI0074 family nucleotidyltransferase substrate-binding subunit [Tunicatimonas sp.]
MEDVRWKQRYDNLQRAFRKLKIGLRIFDYAQYQRRRKELEALLKTSQEVDAATEELEKLDLDREGIIQRFKYCYELFVATLQDLLEFLGEPRENLRGSRTVLSLALQQGFIADHDGWRKIVLARNKTSHAYDEAMADEITEDIINLFYPLMVDLYERLGKEYHS